MFKVTKDPEAILDYGFNWSDWLDADTIDTSTWSVDTGLTIDSESETTLITTVWLSGGTPGKKYKAVNTITTAGGRTDERTLLVTVKNK